MSLASFGAARNTPWPPDCQELRSQICPDVQGPTLLILPRLVPARRAACP